MSPAAGDDPRIPTVVKNVRIVRHRRDAQGRSPPVRRARASFSPIGVSPGEDKARRFAYGLRGTIPLVLGETLTLLARPTRVLLVDDDAVDRHAVVRALRGFPAEIFEAASAAEALKAAAASSFDIVFLDFHIPPANGLEVLRELRARGVTAPAIALTGEENPETVVEFIKAGAADFIPKSGLSPLRIRKSITDALRVTWAEEQAQRAQRALERTARQLRALTDASLVIAAAVGLEARLARITEQAAKIIGAHQAVTSLTQGDDGSQRISSVYLSDKYATHRGYEAPITGEGLYAMVCETKRPMRLRQDELVAFARGRGLGDPAEAHPPMRGWLAAPLLGRDGECIGLIQLSDRIEGDFDEQDEAVLVQLAQLAGVAVESTRLLANEREARKAAELARAEAEANARRVERLQSVTAALSEAQGLGDVASVVVEHTARAFGADLVALYAYAEASGRLELRAQRPRIVGAIEPATPEAFLAKDGEPVAAACLRSGRASYETDASGNHIACVPVKLDGHRPLGVLVAVCRSGRTFSDDERSLFATLAQQCGQALERARLHDAERGARELAERASRAKDDFVGLVSHELRTPLHAMLGWTRMLRSMDLDEAQKARALEVIERNAKTQAQLVDDLLDATRITSGKLRLEKAPVDVARAIDTAVESFRPAAELKGVRLVVRIDRDSGTLDVDGARLQQVVSNLVSNAVKFTPKGGEVRVLVDRTASALVLRVEDTGAGIAPEFLPHVFEKFAQADNRGTAKGGLGLGLHIVHHIVELHGGTIEAWSAGPGRGAQFVVRLPASTDDVAG